MDKAQLEEMKPGQLVQYAKDLGLNTKGKNPRDLVPLVLQKIAGEDADEGDGTGEEIVEKEAEPMPEEIIEQEAGLLDEEDPDAAPPDFDGMTEEEVLMNQISKAEAAKAHPAVLTALYNAYERLTAKPEEAPVNGPQDHPTVHTTNAPPTGRPPKAGSHWPTAEEAIATLAPYTKRGMTITRIPKIPHMLKFSHGGKELAISLKQPLRTVLQHASLLMRPTGKPTEDLSYEELVDLKHRALKKSKSMHGLPDPEMRKFLAPGTAEIVPHMIYPHQARGLKIMSIDNDFCVVVYNGHELKFPTGQELKITIKAVNKLLEEWGPKPHEVQS